ncbi:MAG: HupE/UreJ family protein [Lysobacter sp.]
MMFSVVVLAMVALPAVAHPEHAGASPLLAGLSHPFSGLDHLLAMVSIGFWAASLGGRAAWCVPAAFLISTAAGFGLALAGIVLPAVEPGIAASVLVLGVLIAWAVSLPLGASMGLAALFGVFHGQAHGTELVGAALAFGTGFVVATTLLHLSGIALARIGGGRQRVMLVRGLGSVVVLVGVVLVMGSWA